MYGISTRSNLFDLSTNTKGRSRSQLRMSDDVLAARPSKGCCSTKKTNDFEIRRLEKTHAPRLR